jgi:YidC/Oxa1 family membrane protein insertase
MTSLLANIFGDLYNTFIYQPQLNILYFFYQITNDIGFSIVLLAVTVNLIILPMFAKNYINMQKTRVLQPQIKEIQKKHKEDPQKMLAEMRLFNQKHGLSTGYTLIVLVIQIILISGLYILIRDVVEGREITGVYEGIFGQNNFEFRTEQPIKAFGFIEIGSSASDYIWIPFLSLLLSYIYGMYTFRWAKQPDIAILKKKDTSKKSGEKSAFDPEVMQKSIEFQSIYIMPIFLLVIQYSLPTGLNIYFATSSALALIRQVFLTTYYRGRVKKLIEDIIESDPELKKRAKKETVIDVEATSQMAEDMPVAEVVINQNSKDLKKKTPSKKKKASKAITKYKK